MIKNLAQYIEDETDFVIGTNLFAGFSPATITADRVILIESGGVGNFYLKDKKEKMLQVLVKAQDYHIAMTYAEVIYDLLNGMVGITLPKITAITYFVNTCEAVSLPQSVGADEKGLKNVSTNFIIRIEEV